MKKVLASVVALGMFAAAGSALAGVPSGTGVNGSLHDMTKVVPATADSMGRVCVYCHTPHHAIKDTAGMDNYPLWNHELVDTATYAPYSWATPANNVNDLIIPQNPLVGPSRLCMSCHDGAVAIDSHGDAMSQGGTTTIANRAKLTNDLSNTHPIGFDYNKAATIRNAAAGNITDSTGASEIVPSTFGFATAITVTTDDANQGKYNVVTRNNGPGHKSIADVLYGGNMMTCATCHEVHNKENVAQDWAGSATPNGATVAFAPNYFLYAKENKSLICLSCHIK